MTAPGGEIVRLPIERRDACRRLVPLSELREHYGFSLRWWRYRIAEGMPAHRWVGGLRFDPAEVEAWLDGKSTVLPSRSSLTTGRASMCMEATVGAT